MTTTAASTSSTCCGTTGPARIASPASCCRSTRRRSAGSSASATTSSRAPPLGFTEAPHLYKRDGWYYLLTAEGGTGWGHAVTMARSRTLHGPYELHPDVHILSARHRPDVALQRAGHADLVETQAGETYMVYLCGRPLAEPRPLHARTRDRDSEDDLGRRRLAAHDRRRRACRSWSAGAGGLPPQPHPPAARARRVRRRTPCRSTFNGCARPSPTSCSACARGRATCGSSAARPSAACSRRRSSRGGSRRIASAPRRSWSSSPRTSSRWPDWSATTTAPSSTTCTSVADEAGKHLRVMSALPDQVHGRRVHAADSDRRGRADRAARRGGLRTPAASRIELGGGDVAVAAAAVRRQHSLGRGERAGPAELHRRVRRHGVPGPRRHGAAGGLRLVRVPRAGQRTQ